MQTHTYIHLYIILYSYPLFVCVGVRGRRLPAMFGERERLLDSSRAAPKW